MNKREVSHFGVTGLEKLVSEGKITQEQADKIEDKIYEDMRIADENDIFKDAFENMDLDWEYWVDEESAKKILKKLKDKK